MVDPPGRHASRGVRSATQGAALPGLFPPPTHTQGDDTRQRSAPPHSAKGALSASLGGPPAVAKR